MDNTTRENDMKIWNKKKLLVESPIGMRFHLTDSDNDKVWVLVERGEDMFVIKQYLGMDADPVQGMTKMLGSRKQVGKMEVLAVS